MNWKEIIIWLFVFIIGSLIVTFLVSPNSFSNFKSNIKSIVPSSNTPEVISNVQNTEDALITSCRNSFKDCKEIVNQKYPSASYTLLKIEKFTDEAQARVFYDTWRTPGSSMDFTTMVLLTNMSATFQDISPAVLIAVRATGQGGEVTNVALCDKTGKLTPFTKQSFLC